MKKLLFLMLILASPALAHARLKASDPAADAKVKSPNLIRLTFSEALEPAFSSAELSDAAGKTIPVSKSVGGASITLLPMGLKPGAYKVSWHSVGHDTHRISGSFSFTVVP
jgi:methionine-rich copper-binding protein CopC